MTVRFLTPESRSAAISASGMPHSPNPPTARVWPSATRSASAARASGYRVDVLMESSAPLVGGCHPAPSGGRWPGAPPAAPVLRRHPVGAIPFRDHRRMSRRSRDRLRAALFNARRAAFRLLPLGDATRDRWREWFVARFPALVPYRRRGRLVEEALGLGHPVRADQPAIGH